MEGLGRHRPVPATGVIDRVARHQGRTIVGATRRTGRLADRSGRATSGFPAAARRRNQLAGERATRRNGRCPKYPLLFTTPILRPGPVEAKVMHERGEVYTAAPFIVLTPTPAPTEQKQG